MKVREGGGEGEGHTGAGEKCEEEWAGGRNCSGLITAHHDPTPAGGGESRGKLSLGDEGGKVLF